MPHISVVSAQAGIQLSLKQLPERSWTPAFAGVTMVVEVRP
jgi:hypothetical protein